MSIRILHITPWFPNELNHSEGVFIEDHICALANHCENTILHVHFNASLENQVEQRNKYRFIRKKANSIINKWRFKEHGATKLIEKFIAENEGEFDLVNFYIAYPNAIKIDLLKRRFKGLKFAITECWSAYHHNFNLPENHKGRKRIAQIFHHNTPLAVVSTALGKDIQKFSAQTELKFTVIPNIVKLESAHFKPKEKSGKTTLISINNWSKEKDPKTLVAAFDLLCEKGFEIELRLFGNTDKFEKIQHIVDSSKNKDKIILGSGLSKNEVIDELQRSDIYCQCSRYETFSIICAEAISTGTPVVASNVGGIKDFVNEKNGVLVSQNDAESWALAIEKTIQENDHFEMHSMSREILEKFSPSAVGSRFFNFFESIIKNEH